MWLTFPGSLESLCLASIMRSLCRSCDASCRWLMTTSFQIQCGHKLASNGASFQPPPDLFGLLMWILRIQPLDWDTVFVCSWLNNVLDCKGRRIVQTEQRATSSLRGFLRVCGKLANTANLSTNCPSYKPWPDFYMLNTAIMGWETQNIRMNGILTMQMRHLYRSPLSICLSSSLIRAFRASMVVAVDSSSVTLGERNRKRDRGGEV